MNKNALLRYRTIDNCLKNRYRKWSLNDLIEACSDALYEYEGKDSGVSKRTVQADIEIMRSDKLGYNAPIVVVDRKYYTYEEPDYSITNIPLTDQDLNRLTEVVEILKQFKGFSHFQEVSGMVQKLEDKVYSSKTKQERIIDFEKNEGLRGLEYLDTIYQAIQKKQTLAISYQSFKAQQANVWIFFPYLLKEYRNRWFVLGIKTGTSRMSNLALDRIQSLEVSDIAFQENTSYNLANYYKDVIGVTVSETIRPQEIRLFIFNSNAPYVLTKPLHPSQELIERQEKGIVINITVQINYELEREILGFGDGIVVLQPKVLKERIAKKLGKTLKHYEVKDLDNW